MQEECEKAARMSEQREMTELVREQAWRTISISLPAHVMRQVEARQNEIRRVSLIECSLSKVAASMIAMGIQRVQELREIEAVSPELLQQVKVNKKQKK